MSQTTDELKKDIEKSIAHMQTLRDEVRVKLHLAGMDAKDEWNKLEPHLADVERDVERAAAELTEATRQAVADAVKRLTKLRDKLM
jgi:hypothetical protein